MACRFPARFRICGNTLVLWGERCNTTNTAAENFLGNPATTFCRASTPPTEQPITMMLRCAKRLPSPLFFLWDAGRPPADVIYLLFILRYFGRILLHLGRT